MKKAFDFIKVGKATPKPRSKGMLEIRGPYYSSITYDYLKGVLDDWSDYFDGYKFAGGSFHLLGEDKLKSILDACHDHDVYVSTGGFIERVLLEGTDTVNKYFKECKRLGFDVVEISSGFIPQLKMEDKLAMVKEVKRLGMMPKPEISLMKGAGGGTHKVGYEGEMKMRSLDEFMDEAKMHIKEGVKVIMIESEGLTEDLPPEKWRKDVIKKLTDKFGFEPFMFEASDPPVFKWYLKTFGPDVNLFVDYSQLVEFNEWKYGMWGDDDIWKGKKVHYP
jgi:phosphosulfolactate synthase (CoM biosynthesis protein A)